MSAPTPFQGKEPLHIELAEWGHLLLFAPLSANSLAKVALGLCDNLVTRIARCWPLHAKPMLVAPAMNTKMWEHPATKGQLQMLEDMAVVVIPPVSKVLACGDEGVGAMSPVGTIFRAVVARGHAISASYS